MKKRLSIVLSVVMVLSLTMSTFAMELMKRGTRGEDVREVQEMLIAQGYLEGDADGIFGPKTEAAVLAFQQEKGLDATGIVGEGTWQALENSGEGPEADSDEASMEESAQALEAGTEVAQVAEVDTDATAKASEEVFDSTRMFPSWNPESTALSELVSFVSGCTDESSSDYLAPEDRIAVFDMDGTILCEKAPEIGRAHV